jgi:hypothetical protein
MASTVYKGDISEVTFGKECGLVLAHGGFGGSFQFTTNSAGTQITFSGASEGFFDSSSGLRYPAGMLVGSQLRVIGGGNFSNDDNANNGHVYTIVANAGTTLTVSPAMKETSTTSTTGDELLIETVGTPTIDVGSTYNAVAKSSDESVLTDQFIGLAATVSFPETKVELRRSHIVGVGRDVVIQEPQRFSNEGGSMELMLNSARWLYYSLGREIIDVPSTTMTDPTGHTKVDISAGDTFISYSAGTLTNLDAGDYVIVQDGTETDFPSDLTEPTGTKWGDGSTATNLQHAERNEIRQVLYIDTTLRRIHVEEPFFFNHLASAYTLRRLKYDAGSSNGSPNFEVGAANFGTITNRQERLLFSGATLPSFALEASIRTHNTGSFNGSEESEAAPGSASDSKQLTRVWKGCKVKTFALAADADSEAKLSINFDALYCYTDTGRVADKATATITVSGYGGIGNGKTLTLNDGQGTSHTLTFNGGVAFGSPTSGTIGLSGVSNDDLAAEAIENGIEATTSNITVSRASNVLTLTHSKATSGTGGFSNSTNASGLTVTNFVDNRGDRYSAHRMFENTANSTVNRKKAGIAPNTEKPFFFYNGSISSFGINIAQVTNFALEGSNNTEVIYTIRGNGEAEERSVSGDSLEQIPFGGSRNPNLHIEKATEYNLSMTVIASDPLIWHEFRTNRTHDFTEPITLTLTKAGAGSNREEVVIVVDDYIITEAPLPIPEDKGVIKSELKIMPKHVRVISRDAFFHM